MKILVAGSSGLIGSVLVPFLSEHGHKLVCLKRQMTESGNNSQDVQSAQESKQTTKNVYWNPSTGASDPDAFEGYDAIINLAGENVSTGRWTADKKERIRASRVDVTAKLCEKLLLAKSPPKVFVCASAIGFYGDRGDELLDESSKGGSNFLAQVCRQWEEAASAISVKGVRVVSLRIGVVLSGKGGALGKMLVPFQLGAGGSLGSGKQYLSWVSIDDVAGIIEHVLLTDSLSGPVNIVAPRPVTNAEFTRALGHVLSRPTVFPMPALLVKTIFGEMGEELLLGSARVNPTKLVHSGYQFKHPEIKEALRHLLSR